MEVNSQVDQLTSIIAYIVLKILSWSGTVINVPLRGLYSYHFIPKDPHVNNEFKTSVLEDTSNYNFSLARV